MYVYVYPKTEKVMVANRNVLESVRPGHAVNGVEYRVDTALVSAGIELISFLVASTVLCFIFSLRTMLKTHRCFSCC